MTNDFWSPLTGTIESGSTQYSMFGFDIGVLSRQDRITIDLTTNLGNYSFPLLNLADGTQSLEFRGFATHSPGEYFTSFSITTEFGSGSLPGITDVAVGQLSAVPEPSSLFGIGTCIAGIGASRRRRREKQPQA